MQDLNDFLCSDQGKEYLQKINLMPATNLAPTRDANLDSAGAVEESKDQQAGTANVTQAPLAEPSEIDFVNESFDSGMGLSSSLRRRESKSVAKYAKEYNKILGQIQSKDDLISSDQVDRAYKLGFEIGVHQGAANERQELRKFFENLKREKAEVDQFLDEQAKQLVKVKKQSSKASKDFLQVAKEIIANKSKSQQVMRESAKALEEDSEEKAVA